jgi:hypothetical protein
MLCLIQLTSYHSILSKTNFMITLINYEIYSANLQRMFHGAIEITETRKNEKAFTGSMAGEVGSEERMRIWNSLSSHPASIEHNRSVTILRAWHGTSTSVAKSILNSGFANLATLDDGWFGKGIYFSTHPEYQFVQKKSFNCYFLDISSYMHHIIARMFQIHAFSCVISFFSIHFQSFGKMQSLYPHLVLFSCRFVSLGSDLSPFHSLFRFVHFTHFVYSVRFVRFVHSFTSFNLSMHSLRSLRSLSLLCSLCSLYSLRLLYSLCLLVFFN